MGNEDKLPRGHAYVRMRNAGYKIDVDFPEIDSECAQRMIEAAMRVFREDEGKAMNETKTKIQAAPDDRGF